jgi:hypothetical protein
LSRGKFLFFALFPTYFILCLLTWYFLSFRAPLAPEQASSASAGPNIEKPAATATRDIPSASHTTSPAPASSPAPDKTTSPAKDDPPLEQDTSAPDVHMDSGAQQNPSAPNVHLDIGAQLEAPDSSAPTGGTGTTEDAGASHKSADMDPKGKGPVVPEVRTIPEPVSAGQAAPAAPEQPAPKAPPTPTKTATPDKTSAPAKTAAPAKTGTLKLERILKSGTQSATTALATAAPRPSSALALHFGKAAARPSFFDMPELEGRVSLLTKSDKSLGSLKERCEKWNDADFMDTAESKKKKLAEASATGDPADILATKPIPIACELLSIQQRLHILADATNVSLFYIHIPSPQKCRLSGIRTFGIFQYLLYLAVFQINWPTYELDLSFKS